MAGAKRGPRRKKVPDCSYSLGNAGPSFADGNSLDRAIDRGKTLYVFDRAAWLTSDDVLARLPPDRQGEVGGWIVTPLADGVHVDYFGKDAAANRVVYGADVKGETVANAVVYPSTAEPLLKEPASQMVRALRAARDVMGRHADWRSCSNAPLNTVVLPPDSKGTVAVYFLTPQTEVNSFPMGGHYEVDIARDGSTAYTRPFTNACLTMPKPPLGGGTQPAGLFVTHILDPQPTEIHVFEQYYVGLPVFVATGPGTVWKVEAGTIQKVAVPTAK